MLKKSILTLFCFLFSIGLRAEPPASPLEYLNAMRQAQQTAHYEQIYVFQEGRNEMKAWRYRHAYQHRTRYAQLINLEGVREELLQQGERIGYFGNFQPFSLHTAEIYDHRPSILHTHFHQLEQYSFIDMGRDRIANRTARLIRLVPNESSLYQYRLWIDEQSKLLLKSELSDANGTILESFRVLHLTQNSDELLEMAQVIRSVALPPLVLNQDKSSIHTLTWQPKWLPKGFYRRSLSLQTLPDGEVVESQQYSDGVFSFTLYVAEVQHRPLSEHFWQEGKTSLYTQTIGDKDVVIVGEIPLATARHILQEITLNTPLMGEKK